MRPPARHPQLRDPGAADQAGLSRPGEDPQLALVAARLTEGVVVGVEGRAPQLYPELFIEEVEEEEPTPVYGLVAL